MSVFDPISKKEGLLDDNNKEVGKKSLRTGNLNLGIDLEFEARMA